ncbi:serine/threonine-protein kinase [Solidesulfovibrio aerotolerans]|uniref:serine/threonine-protein kinase n=1 Tax=Solidesulfovibrio aerotolerans TaxID=295255 RepID=UPI001FE373B8|nr:serine/threonine-protein kinase [Solidesulfovibrio aerotolerans]
MLVRQVGRGAFGEVWLAKDHALDREFAIKILDNGIEIDQRLKEAQVGHLFTHNNLVRVHQADVATDGKVVIAMDFLPDGSITSQANPSNFLPLPIAVRAMIDIMQGLEHLHLNNMFHNDVKPENVLLGLQGQAMLGDYGIVCVSSDGSPVLPSKWYVLHAAPETCSGCGIEARTDLFQAGLTFFRMLVGLGALKAKFQALGQSGYENALAKGTLVTKNDFPPFIPSAICRLILTSISPSLDDRFQSALEMRRALEKIPFSGYWTVDSTGMLVGKDSKYTYRFVRVCVSKNNYTFTAFKKYNTSGRETKISSFSKKDITSSDVRKVEAQFVKAVIQGKVL